MPQALEVGARVLAALLLSILIWSGAAGPLQAAPGADLVLAGELTGEDHRTYREIPFRVPEGVKRLTVEFEYTGKAERSVIDLGLRDPTRFRGWSGGNKSRFEVSEADATPSYLAGPLPAGTWWLVLGVPNIRSTAHARYTARVWFDRSSVFTGFSPTPVAEGLRWYRGDLHMHTGHSDGSCRSSRGAKVGCPVYRTLDAARARGLDFIAVTDHNAVSQNQSLRELAPAYDDLLLIPGREVTTFFGHANVLGPTVELEFQIGSPRAPDFTSLQRQVEASGGIFSINHPAAPSGEDCMGCGWTAEPTDFARVQAIEVINGGTLAANKGDDRLMSGVPFWESQLNQGRRITAIGGSDNHNPDLEADKPSAVGYPTTVVQANELSTPAILAAIRSGRVFIDVEGSRDRKLTLTAETQQATAEMGGVLPRPKDGRARVRAHVANARGGRVTLIAGPADLTQQRLVATSDEVIVFELKLAPGDAVRWIRAEVRGADDDRLLLLSNPVYIQ